MWKLINSIIAEDNMENIRQYISRGRGFEHLNIEALKPRWISVFKALASDIENYQAIYENFDVDSEFQVRKIEPPSDTVKEEQEKLILPYPRKRKTRKAGQSAPSYCRYSRKPRRRDSPLARRRPGALKRSPTVRHAACAGAAARRGC